MADIKTSTAEARQRLVADIAKLVATVERQRLEQIQMEARRVQNEENIRLSLETVADYKQKLKDFDDS